MGLLSSLWAALVRQWRVLWYNPDTYFPQEMPVEVVSVVNMPSTPPVSQEKAKTPDAPKRVLLFRGFSWTEEGEEGDKIRFSREIAVSGRAVKSELVVAKADLVRHDTNRYTLNGRE